MIITDAELKLIMDMRKIKEKHEARIVGIDLDDSKDRTVSAVFAAPKEDLKDWPEDRGEHPQRGLGVALPQVDDINVVYLNRPSAIELQDTEIGIPEPVTDLLNPVA